MPRPIPLIPVVVIDPGSVKLDFYGIVAASIFCLASIASIVVCVWILVCWKNMETRLKTQTFAKQLWHLAVADIGAALVPPLWLILAICHQVLHAHLTRLCWFPVILADDLFVCVSVTMDTMIAIGFTRTVSRNVYLIKFLEKSAVLAWLLGALAAYVSSRQWLSLGQERQEYSSNYVMSWCVLNLAVCITAYFFIYCTSRQHPSIRDAVFDRLRRRYMMAFFLKHVAFLLGVTYTDVDARVNTFLLQALSYSMSGVLNALGYHFNYRVMHQPSKWHENILEDRLRFLEDTSDVSFASPDALLLDRLEGAGLDVSSSFTQLASPGTHAFDAEASSEPSRPCMAAAKIDEVCTRVALQCHCHQVGFRACCSRIDEMWAQEQRISHQDEMLRVAVEAAVDIQNGCSMNYVIDSAIRKADDVKAKVEESIDVRMEARGPCFLEDGLEGLRHRVGEQHEQLCHDLIKPMIDQPNGVDPARVIGDALATMKVLEMERESILSRKTTDTEKWHQLSERIPDLLQHEITLAEASLQSAKANPESARLQKIALENMTIRMRLTIDLPEVQDVFPRLPDMSCSFTPESANRWLDYILFAMEKHPLDQFVQSKGCLALSMSVACGFEAKLEASRRFEYVVLQALENHASSFAVKRSARAALRALVSYVDKSDSIPPHYFHAGRTALRQDMYQIPAEPTHTSKMSLPRSRSLQSDYVGPMDIFLRPLGSSTRGL